MLNFEFLDCLRAQEMAVAGVHLGAPPRRLLEIGAGNGAQARALAQAGFDVQAIEVAGSIYEAQQVFPVRIYDGLHMPFADHSFDVVFSSHVLMHVADTAAFDHELQRVLKPSGSVVHVVPTSSWRFWTLALHYPAKIFFKCRQWWLSGQTDRPSSVARIVDESAVAVTESNRGNSNSPKRRSLLSRMLGLPPRIGETGNVLTELYLFSEQGWQTLFRRNGWVASPGVSNGVFYTGHMALGAQLPLSARRVLSNFLGSSGKVYVLRTPAAAEQAKS